MQRLCRGGARAHLAAPAVAGPLCVQRWLAGHAREGWPRPRRPLHGATSPMRSTHQKCLNRHHRTTPDPAGLTLDIAERLARIAAVFHEHEMAAAGIPLTDGSTVGTRDLLTATSADANADSEDAAASAGPGHSDVYSSLSTDIDRRGTWEAGRDDADDVGDVASLIMLDWLVDGPAPSEGATAPVSNSASHASSLSPSSATALAVGALTALTCAEHDPAANLHQLLTLGSASNSTSLACDAQSATELLLQGLDVKAVLPDNTLRDLRLRRKCLRQADFTFTRWENVRSEHCDFSMGVFYKGVMRGPCVFLNCCFDGSVLTGLCLEPGGSGGATDTVAFVNCSFRRAAMGIVLASAAALCGGGRTNRKSGGTPIFLRCDFDLATFERSEGFADYPEAFKDCVNVRTAARFPLRARSL